MPRTRSVHSTDEDGLERLLTPRDDVVVREAPPERAGSSAELSCVEGPFASYRRRLSWTEPEPGRFEVTQEVDWRLAVPYWAWLYRPVVSRFLRRPAERGVRPWWSFPVRLSPSDSALVSTMTAFNLMAGLLYGLLSQVLTFVAADLGDGSRSEQAVVLSLARLGVVVTLVALVVADRLGRRRVALWSFGLAVVLTLATGFAPSLAVFTVLQLLARNLAVAGLLAVDTIVVEELPAGSRAMASGLGALAYGLGAGFVVVSLPLADVGPAGWRLTFGVALVCIPVLADAARRLPESGRFVRTAAAPKRARGRVRGTRLVLLGILFFALNLLVAPASQLQNDYLRTERGFSGLWISVFVIATSTPGGVGVLLGGRWADTRGRRATLVPGLLAVGGFTAWFFAASGPAMWAASLLSTLVGGLSVAALGVIGPELFPTARRGGARGTLATIAVAGSTCGLLLAGFGVDRSGYGTTFALLALGPLIAAGLATLVPETRGRELEEINPGDAAPGPSQRADRGP